MEMVVSQQEQPFPAESSLMTGINNMCTDMYHAVISQLGRSTV